jgi:L-alanine-DL-glutamate epimerase-like enolase superfamily enzyme
MRIAEWSLHFYRLPYSRPVQWFNSVEDGAVFVLLRIVGSDGSLGVAEAPLKPTWSGVSPRSIAAVLEDLLLPAVQEVDIADASAVSQKLARFPENYLAKMLVDNACWTLRAAAQREPLWRLLKGEQSVEVSWCVTRQPPDQMAREAAEITARHGFRALKIKGGQGLETDLSALRKIRASVEGGVDFYVDANGAYSRTEAAEYIRAIAGEGAKVAEDPCQLLPDEQFAELASRSPIPVMVDSACASFKDAVQFLERGATALSVKPGRIGITEARRIAELAVQKGANVCSGMYAESALGTLISLQLSCALREPLVPAEQSFYLMMRDQILREPLHVAGGRVRLPAIDDIATLIDWDLVKHHAFQP